MIPKFIEIKSSSELAACRRASRDSRQLADAFIRLELLSPRALTLRTASDRIYIHRVLVRLRIERSLNGAPQGARLEGLVLQPPLGVLSHTQPDK